MRIECPRYIYYPTILSVLLAAVLSLGGCTNPEKAKAAHLAKGEAYLKDSKYQEATIEFRNALQIDDKLAAAHWGLAQAFEGLQRFPEMVEELQRTVQLDQNNLDARIKLGNIYVLAGRKTPKLIEEAARLTKEILDKDPNHIEGHILKSSVLFAQNKPEDSLAELNKAIELDPKRVESQLSLARYYQVTHDQTKAEEIFRRAVSLKPDSALAHTEYGKFLVQIGKPAEAEIELKKGVEVGPNDRGARFVLASFYFLNKQFDKAEQAYSALADLDKDKPEGRAVLADYYALANQPDNAIKVYQEIMSKWPDFTRGRYRLAEIMMTRSDFQGARNQLEEVLKKDQHDRQALVLRARIRSISNEKDYKGALEDLQEVLRQEPNSKAGLYSMAQLNISMGLMDQARSYAAELEKNYPDYLPAKLMQLQLTLAGLDFKGVVRQGTDFLDRLAKTAPDNENPPQLIAEMRTKAYGTRALAQANLKNYPAARQDLMAAHEVSPNDPEVYNTLANLSVAEEKPDEAIASYENALKVDTANYNALSGLTVLYSRQGQTAKAHERLDQVLASYPNNAGLHFLKAQVYGVERNIQGTEAELNKALELDPNYVNAYYALAALYTNSRQEDRAIQAYRRLLERKPDNAGAYTMIGMLEDGRKNYDAAVESYRKALELDQSSVIAANNLAWIYAVYQKGNLDEAVRLAQGVVQRSPNIAGFADTLGWVYFKKGLYGAAVEQLQKAVNLDSAAAKNVNGTPSPTYPFHLGMALKAKGDKEGARQQLEAALRLGEKAPFADSEEARKALSTL